MSQSEKPFGPGEDQRKSTGELRAVPGAANYRFGDQGGYNMLDPMMSQFMGRCIGAVKKAGVRAGGTGQFSISISDGAHELILDEFWSRVCSNPEAMPDVIKDVVAAAQKLASL